MKLKKFFCSAFVLSLFLASTSLVNANSKFERISGADRYVTSLKTSNTVSSNEIVLANGNSFADALSAINVTNKTSAKLILVDNKTNVKNIIKNIKKVYIVGGADVISYQFEKNIRQYVSNVIRLKGNDRYKTNLETLSYFNYKNVGVASGENYPDALVSSSLLKEKGDGLMLVNGTKDYNTNNLKVEYTFGARDAVKQDGGIRLGGLDRFDTAIEIAKLTNSKNMVLTTGTDFADALSSSNLVNSKNAYVMIAPNVNKIEIQKLKNKIDNVYVVGGTSAISDNLVNSTLNMINGKNPNPPKPTPVEKNVDVKIIDITCGKTLTQTKIKLKTDDNILNKIKIPNGYKLISNDVKFIFRGNDYDNDIIVIPDNIKTGNESNNEFINNVKSVFNDKSMTKKVTFWTTYNFDDMKLENAMRDYFEGYPIEFYIKNLKAINPVLQNSTGQFKEYKLNKVELKLIAPNGGNVDVYEYNKINNRIDDIITSKIKSGMTYEQKAQALSSWLSDNVEYESSFQDPYTAFENKKASCVGFSEAFEIMAKKIGMNCVNVSNDTHQWNLIKIDGEWKALEPQAGESCFTAVSDLVPSDDQKNKGINYDKSMKLLKDFNIIK